MPRWIKKGIPLLIGSVLLSACASSPDRLYQGGATMGQIMQGQTDHTVDRKFLDASIHEHLLASENAAQRLFPRYEAYTRDSLNEINQLFPRHRNPRITGYVHPHLATKDNLPVPGYTTAFNLYRSDEYALPSEVPPAYLPRIKSMDNHRLRSPRNDYDL